MCWLLKALSQPVSFQARRVVWLGVMHAGLLMASMMCLVLRLGSLAPVEQQCVQHQWLQLQSGSAPYLLWLAVSAWGWHAAVLCCRGNRQ